MLVIPKSRFSIPFLSATKTSKAPKLKTTIAIVILCSNRSSMSPNGKTNANEIVSIEPLVIAATTEPNCGNRQARLSIPSARPPIIKPISCASIQSLPEYARSMIQPEPKIKNAAATAISKRPTVLLFICKSHLIYTPNRRPQHPTTNYSGNHVSQPMPGG